MQTPTSSKVTPVSPSELDPLLDIVSEALVVPSGELERELRFFKTCEKVEFRSIKIGHEDEIVGGLALCEWNHFFGGREVKAAPIMAVGIATEYRRQGLASVLMSEILKELYRRDFPISTLYAANAPLYRKVGYESAIERYRFTVQMSNIQVRDNTYQLVRVPNELSDTIENLYIKSVQNQNGAIRRNATIWHFKFDLPEVGTPHTFLIKNGNEDMGYVIFFQRTEDNPLRIMDYAALDRTAVLRILTAAADHSSRIRSIRLDGGIADPLIMQLPDNTYDMVKSEPCMLRIVSVPLALEARGYPSTINFEIHLDVSDNIIDENNGKFVFKVKDGRGSVERGGEGRVKIDIRSLAQLYTSLMTAEELALAGMLSADAKDLEKLSLIFSGPKPFIRDHF